MNREGTSEPSEVFEVMADDYARRILVAADRKPMTAKDLSEACDASLTTVYRRVSMLQNQGLIEEHRTVGDDGSHRSVFETALEGFHVELSGGSLELTLETRDELADSFTGLWSDMRGDS